MSRYQFGSIVDRSFRRTLQRLADDASAQGKAIQDLVAEGQLTEGQYADLIKAVNGLIAKGDVAVSDIDKSRGLFDATFFTSKFLEQLNNGTINATNVLPGSIGSVEISDDGVSEENVGFISKSKNMLNTDPEKLHIGKAQTSDGSLIDSASVNTTDYYIPVKPETTYHKNVEGSVLMRDRDLNIVGYVSFGEAGSFTTTPEARFITVSYRRYIDTPQLELGDVETPYEPYKRTINKDLVEVNGENIDDGSVPLAKLSGLSVSRNLYNSSAIAEGFVSRTSGNIVEDSGNRVSDFIPVKEQTDYTVSGNFILGNINYACYDSNKIFIDGGQFEIVRGYNEFTLKTPINAEYLRLSHYRTSTSVQIEEGSTATDYVTYHRYLPEIVEPKRNEDNAEIEKTGTLEVVGASDVVFKFPLSSEISGSFRYSNSGTGDDFMKGRESSIYGENGTALYNLTDVSSNKEFAISVDDTVNGNIVWFPTHSGVPSAFLGATGFIKLVADGNEIDLSQTSGEIQYGEAKLIQKVECKLPSDTEPRAIITFISHIKSNKNKNSVKIEWLQDSQTNAGYIFMTPMSTPDFVDTLLTDDFTEIKSQPDATERTKTAIDNTDNSEFIFTSDRTGKTNIAFKTKITKQSETIKSMFWEHRSGDIEKLYPKHYEGLFKAAGTIDYYEGEYSIELIPRANEIYSNEY